MSTPQSSWSDFAFTTLEAALKAGFHVYDKTHEGFIVRRKFDESHWELGLVDFSLQVETR